MLKYAKAYAALIGSVCTALLGVYAADSAIGKVLTVISVIATAVATFGVKNADAKPKDEAGAVEPGSLSLGLVLGAALVYFLLR